MVKLFQPMVRLRNGLGDIGSHCSLDINLDAIRSIRPFPWSRAQGASNNQRASLKTPFDLLLLEKD